MTNANFERFDNARNSYGMISDAIRSVARAIEEEHMDIGAKDIFGEVITAERNKEYAKLTRRRMADLLEKLAAELRAY